jgi:hypothetical protein
MGEVITRHSLRPLFSLGRPAQARLGQIMPRECICAFEVGTSFRGDEVASYDAQLRI